MKIRYCVLGMILILVIGFWGSTSYLSNHMYIKVNMEDLNDRYTQVVNTLEEQPNPSEDMIEQLEEEFQCDIALRGDVQYETVVHNAIMEQKISMDYCVGNQLLGKVIFDGQQQKLQMLYEAIWRFLGIVFLVIGIALSGLFVWIYWEYIRPFRELERFATQISKGNFDFPLQIHKHNYFGAFTESFDIMREELKKAKQGEYEANRSKKELVASLSHDIKTPVATIKAICEVLMLKVKNEENLEKVMVIMQKADVINALISNLFHATLEELQLLRVTPTEMLSTEIPSFFDDINYDGKIRFINAIPECLVLGDSLRLSQVIDNIINNSYKYAGTDIEVSYTDTEDTIVITIRDFGSGVTLEELPLLTEKFYRGNNAEGKDGTGLGLYLSKQFMEGMQGDFCCENAKDPSGFLVTLTIKKV